jgi:hypothetical protein
MGCGRTNPSNQVQVVVKLENLHDKSVLHCVSEGAYIDQRTEMCVRKGRMRLLLAVLAWLAWLAWTCLRVAMFTSSGFMRAHTCTPIIVLPPRRPPCLSVSALPRF